MADSARHSLIDRKVAASAFDFIDRVRNVRTIDELRAAFAVQAEASGFEHFLFGKVRLNGNELFPNLPMKAWPDGWYDRYLEQGYVATDPAAQQMATNVLPYTWDEVVERGKKIDVDQRVFNEARAWNMNQGLCVPVHNLGGLQGFATLSGFAPDMSQCTKAAFQLMVIYVHARADELAGQSLEYRGAPDRLTLRERECVSWIAAGKSTWEIGEILSLSELTVATYIKSAMRKMNVVTRAQLAVQALKSGEIAL